MTVASLSPAALAQRLAGPGLFLRTGPFINHIVADNAAIAHGIGLMYSDYPLAESAEFADFHLGFDDSMGWRRWWRPQVRFSNDGERPFAPLPREQGYAMFEWMLNWCVSSRAHDYLIIHAAVVEKDGCAAILPAPPGSGKSTLCTALVHRGWRLLSDELALIRLADGEIVPLPRPISLKNASIGIMRGYLDAPVFSQPADYTHKGTVAHLKAPADSVARAGETARPAWVVFPQYAAGEAAVLARVPRARAFMQLADNAFNFSLLGADGFNALAGVIARSEAYTFRYSVLDEAIAVFASLAPGQP
ncbi:MAG: HprK-related kinase A [Massilia sp.]